MDTHRCDACYEDFDIPDQLVKCKECTYKICKECADLWLIKKAKVECPQCRRYHTFDIKVECNNSEECLCLMCQEKRSMNIKIKLNGVLFDIYYNNLKNKITFTEKTVLMEESKHGVIVSSNNSLCQSDI